MNKQTSAHVSTIAAEILNTEVLDGETPAEQEFNELLEKAKAVAGSALAQDETPAGKSGSHGIHPAPGVFDNAQIAADPILHFFHYSHLPPGFKETSRHFCILAKIIVDSLPRNAERTVALRKLLEAKDAAVRANLPAPTFGQKELDLASPKLGEAVETGGHSEDRDGPVPFGD